MIRLVVFDMAGTTIDEDNLVYKTLQKSINAKGFNLSLEQVLTKGAGKEKQDAVKSILKTYAQNNDVKLAEEIYQQFIPDLEKAYQQIQVLPQPHTLEIFNKLKQRNIRVVLNTGYNAEIARLLISKLGWTEGVEFDRMITSGDVKKSRPDPEMIDLAMHIFQIEDPLEVVKVGDSIIDIEEGQNAGCLLSIGITTGAHTFWQLNSAGPDFIINDLLELIPIIDRINKLTDIFE